MSYDALFESVFGRKIPAQHYPMTVDLMVDGEAKGTMLVYVNPYSQALFFPSDRLKAALKPHVSTDEGALFLQPMFKKEKISGDTLRSLGFSIQFYQEHLRVDMATPVRWRLRTRINLQEPTVLSSVSLNPSFFSMFLNISGEYVLDQDAKEERGLYMDYDMTGTVRDWFSVESEFGSSLHDGFFLQGLRAVHDDHVHRTSYYIGDIGSAQRSSSIYLSKVLGASIYKSYEEFGEENPGLVYRKELALESDSRVKILINDHEYYSAYLKAGRYEFVNPPLEEGRNCISFFLEPSHGNVPQTIREDIVYDASLLKPGSMTYSAVAGLPISTGKEVKILSYEPEVGGDLRMGMTDTATLQTGFRVSGHSFGLIEGMQVARAYGIWRHAIRTDIFSDRQFSKEVQIQFRKFDKPIFKSARLRQEFRFLYLEPSSVPGVSQGNQDKQIKIQWNPFFILNKKKTIQWRTSFSYYLDHQFKKVSQELIFNQRYKHVLMQHAYSIEKESSNDLSFNFYTQLFFLSPRSKRAIKIRRETQDWLADLSYEMRHLDQDNLKLSTQYTQLGSEESAMTNQLSWGRFFAYSRHLSSESSLSNRVQLRYSGRRGAIRYLSRSGKERGFQDRLNFETALVFVDGHFGITRRVQDSFALIYTPSAFQYRYIEFNSRDRMDWLGPAVVSGRGLGRPYTVSILDSKMKKDQFIPFETVQIIPRKRQGVSVSVASEGHLMVSGRLLSHASQDALAYVFPQLKSKDGTLRPFFTNASGRFVLMGIKPGKYTIDFNESVYRAVDIVIEETEGASVDLGEIHVDLD